MNDVSLLSRSPLEFCYWLQGFFELSDPDEITDIQLQQIKEHLNLVFDKQTSVTYNGIQASC